MPLGTEQSNSPPERPPKKLIKRAVVCPFKKALQSQLPKIPPVSEKVSFQISPSAAKHSTCLVETSKLSRTVSSHVLGNRKYDYGKQRGIKITH